MQFYLPNFEDLADPGYDFIHDEPSPDRDSRFLHDWYAHQFSNDPIFDGARSMNASKKLSVSMVCFLKE